MVSETQPGLSSATLPQQQDDAEPLLQQGDEVGRFVVLERLGEGGMGVVVAAYDPLLDRKVALKLLRPDLTPTRGGTEARARLKREAQAMARLRHPNVVAVFEVGDHADQVFLAMEYVPGGTLATWADGQRKRPGGWRAIVDAYVQAGQGLVAAHEQGLVHRDFKPANVLVDGDRFQVTDFGISSLADTADDDSAGSRIVPNLEPSLTRTGLLMGTAPYMSPERHRSEPATASTDQFAFCVALYEGLFGERPFRGKTGTAVAQAILDGKPEPPPSSSRVPEYVRNAIMRGLSSTASKRWPSMAELLRTLSAPDEADVGRRTRTFTGVVLGVTFIVLPALSANYGIPTDTSTYGGTVLQTGILLGLVLGLAYWARESVRATPRNRHSFAALFVTLLLSIPLELGHAAADLPIRDSHVMHLFFWGAMVTMYAALADLRVAVLGCCYLIAYGFALLWPDQFGLISSAANACFVITILIRNRALDLDYSRK